MRFGERPMTQDNHNSYYLEPGYIYFSKRSVTVRTVVGSCVAVCLWDRNRRYGGMNHFVRPRVDKPEKATPHYGNVATAALVRIMEEAGCKRGDLSAHIVGGGCPEGLRRDTVGNANVRAAREVLSRKGIKIVSEDVGGHVGRKLAFNSGTGELAILKTQKIRQTDWK